ncbi:MAG: CBS domain-containing protein, partial [Candidatus Altiarchaeales archaeon]|nr:CBS domain-containing protein [Candidatus Altiarchaeales archaeon]
MELPDVSEIKRLRKKFSLTQTELAKRAGISQSLIARIEAGTVDPRYSKVSRIFRALGESGSKEITAEEIMSSKVFGVQAGSSLERAANVMKERNVSQIPVFEGKKAVGSLSEKTILNLIAGGVNIETLPAKRVREFMDEPFPIVNQSNPFSSISALLEHNTAVLVVEKGEIEGIVTNADI